MRTSFTLLLVEDSRQDAELVLETLREAGLDPLCRRVDTKEAYLRELNVSVPDLILSDFSLPQFDGKAALQLLKATGLEIPFIIVSGCIGEDMAVECMKAGAADYLLKERLGRLPHAVSQALERKRLVEEKRQRNSGCFSKPSMTPSPVCPTAPCSLTGSIGSFFETGEIRAACLLWSISASRGFRLCTTALGLQQQIDYSSKSPDGY